MLPCHYRTHAAALTVGPTSTLSRHHNGLTCLSGVPSKTSPVWEQLLLGIAEQTRPPRLGRDDARERRPVRIHGRPAAGRARVAQESEQEQQVARGVRGRRRDGARRRRRRGRVIAAIAGPRRGRRARGAAQRGHVVSGGLAQARAGVAPPAWFRSRPNRLHSTVIACLAKCMLGGIGPAARPSKQQSTITACWA